MSSTSLKTSLIDEREMLSSKSKLDLLCAAALFGTMGAVGEPIADLLGLLAKTARSPPLPSPHTQQCHRAGAVHVLGRRKFVKRFIEKFRPRDMIVWDLMNEAILLSKSSWTFCASQTCSLGHSSLLFGKVGARREHNGRDLVGPEGTLGLLDENGTAAVPSSPLQHCSLEVLFTTDLFSSRTELGCGPRRVGSQRATRGYNPPNRRL